MLFGCFGVTYYGVVKVLKCCVCDRAFGVRKGFIEREDLGWRIQILASRIYQSLRRSESSRQKSKDVFCVGEEMVGALRKLAYSRPSRRSKHQYLMVEGVGGKRINPAATFHGVPLLENFEAAEHPDEPMETDDPVRCPLPEKSIVQDGLIWRERVARHFHRPIDRVSTWQEGDAVRLAGGVVSNPGRPNHSNISDKSLLVAHSAPETAVSQMLL